MAQWFRLPTSTERGLDLWLGTKILHATQCDQNKLRILKNINLKKRTYNPITKEINNRDASTQLPVPFATRGYYKETVIQEPGNMSLSDTHKICHHLDNGLFSFQINFCHL